ncbi:hypothetical protein [Larkinella soli]|uniref:hypothetical protein n=1 Tax=Larkinella soli TaxID=1770527 RepID=UPI000FFC3D14|nr:hypothetical protein [Larkinella soli]
MKTTCLPILATEILFFLILLIVCKEDPDDKKERSRKTCLFVHKAARGAGAWKKAAPLSRIVFSSFERRKKNQGLWLF